MLGVFILSESLFFLKSMLSYFLHILVSCAMILPPDSTDHDSSHLTWNKIEANCVQFHLLKSFTHS